MWEHLASLSIGVMKNCVQYSCKHSVSSLYEFMGALLGGYWVLSWNDGCPGKTLCDVVAQWMPCWVSIG